MYAQTEAEICRRVLKMFQGKWWNSADEVFCLTLRKLQTECEAELLFDSSLRQCGIIMVS